MADALDLINNILATEASRIGPDILERTVGRSPLLDMIQAGDWPEGMGSSIQVLSWSRMLPADATTAVAKRPTWSDVNFSADDPDGFFGGSAGTATGGSCAPPTTTLPSGFATKTYQLQHMALESPMICVNDLRSSFKRAETLKAMSNALQDVTPWAMLQRSRQLFASICTAQVLVSAEGGSAEATTMPSGANKTPRMFNRALMQKCWNRMARRSSGKGAAMKVNGAPVWTAIMSGEASFNYKTASGIRDDYRWDSSKVPELLMSLGATTSPVDGFMHVIDLFPDRWNWTAGAWEWIAPFIYSLDASTNKYMMVENPGYETASWEDTTLFSPEVFKMIYPGSIADAGSGANFSPVNYRGDWSWVNIKERARNIDGTVGNFRGVFMLGGKPEQTDFGYLIRHARCDTGTNYTTCPA